MKKILISSVLLSCFILSSCDSTNQKAVDMEARLKTLEEKVASSEKVNEIDDRLKKIESNVNKGEWILWRSPTCFNCLMASINFYAERAFSSEAECRNRVKEIGKNLQITVNGLDTNSDAMTIVYEKGQDKYFCLPKVIDPRK